MLDLAFRPDPALPVPAYEQLEEYLRGLVERGSLVPGERLPPTRELSTQLQLSRNTVSHAYARLAEAGVLRACVGRGTFVAGRGHGARRRAVRETPMSGPAPRPFAWEPRLAEGVREFPVGATRARSRARPLRFDFRGGRVDPALLPVTLLRRAWSRALDKNLPDIANPSGPFGHEPLREEIALALVSRGIACEPDDVLVVRGAQQALDLVTRCLVGPGDRVAVEDPGYPGVALPIRTAAAVPVPVAVDGEGLQTERLREVLRAGPVAWVYTTPSAQSPTGVRLSPRRRADLFELSEEFDVPIVEDDYDAELRFEGGPQPALKTQDTSGRVIYVGTFSKALFPGLRVGYVVAARPLLARLALLGLGSDLVGDALSQSVVVHLLRTGALERHVRRLRREYRLRRSAMLAALERAMPSGTLWRPPAGGHAVWVRLPPGCDPSAVAERASAAGIAYARGDVFSLGADHADSVALAFVNQPPDAVRAGVAEFGAIVADVTASGGRTRPMAGRDGR